MKYICIGRNYADHAKELGNQVPDEPVIFIKPDNATLRSGQSFYIPDQFQEVHHELELIVRISKKGKHIAEKFAHKYYDQVGLGIDFTARDKQSELKKKGLPWELAKGFDQSAFVSKLQDKSEFPDLNNLQLRLDVNGETRQNGNTCDMLFNIDQMIAFVSQYFTLKIGDVLFTGTPAGVSAVKKDDVLEGFLQESKLFTLQIK